MKSNKIVVLDFGLGNLRSVSNAIEACGATAIVTRDRATIAGAKMLVLPGVGAFKHGMANLIEYDLIEPIKDFAKTGKPLLGICLGMQLFMDSSEEHGWAAGLGLIAGDVKLLQVKSRTHFPLPHIDWGLVRPTNSDSALFDRERLEHFYFVHSYVVFPKRADEIMAVSEYGGSEFCSVIGKENIIGMQFHPEKSGPAGLKVLDRLVQNC